MSENHTHPSLSCHSVDNVFSTLTFVVGNATLHFSGHLFAIYLVVRVTLFGLQPVACTGIICLCCFATCGIQWICLFEFHPLCRTQTDCVDRDHLVKKCSSVFSLQQSKCCDVTCEIYVYIISQCYAPTPQTTATRSVKDKKKNVKDEEEKEKPVADEYSYYTTSEEPQAKVKLVSKSEAKKDVAKRKAPPKSTPKKAAKKARGGRPRKPPSPPTSPTDVSESDSQEEEEEERLVTDDFPSEVTSEQSEVFEAEYAVPKKATERNLPAKEKTG